MKKIVWPLLLAAVLLAAGTAGALGETEEAVRTAGAKWPYIAGGIAAIVIGICLSIGMAGNQSRNEVLVTPTFIPIPMPLIPAVLGIVIGIAAFIQTPADRYVLGGVQYRLYEKSATAVGLVHHVVMHQGGIVQHLHGCGYQHVLWQKVSTSLG